MTDSPRPARPRRRLDARLLIGVVLVLASVAGVVALVTSIDRRVPVLAAAQAIAPGESIDAGALVVRQVALDGADELYLPAESELGDAVALSAIRPGELIARSAVGSAGDLEAASVVLALASPVSTSVETGDRVDIWIATPAASGVTTVGEQTARPPAVLVAGAVVIRVVEDEGIVGGSDRLGLEVLVPRDRVALVVQALADGSSLAAVPAGAPGAAPEGEAESSAGAEGTGAGDEPTPSPAPAGSGAP